jgi:hypothetical protein
MADQNITISVPDAPAAPKPDAGYKSTEFGTMVVTMLALASGAIPAQYAGIVAAVGGVYMACRTLLKAAHALGYAKQVPDLPALPAGSVTTTVTPPAKEM